MPQRKKLSTTIGVSNYTYLPNMKAGRPVDEVVEVARSLYNRAALERKTAAYFANLIAQSVKEEKTLEDILSRASHEIDFGSQP